MITRQQKTPLAPRSTTQQVSFNMQSWTEKLETGVLQEIYLQKMKKMLLHEKLSWAPKANISVHPTQERKVPSQKKNLVRKVGRLLSQSASLSAAQRHAWSCNLKKMSRIMPTFLSDYHKLLLIIVVTWWHTIYIILLASLIFNNYVQFFTAFRNSWYFKAAPESSND